MDFRAAIAGLGATTSVDFEDIDASPVNNTFAGREPFDGECYAKSGITFANPDGHPLFIAPGGLFWNESNSLSVGQFPFDDNAGDANDDNLVVKLKPPSIAVGFTLVDNAKHPMSSFNSLTRRGTSSHRLVFRQTSPLFAPSLESCRHVAQSRTSTLWKGALTLTMSTMTTSFFVSRRGDSDRSDNGPH